jgi:hypothetical protein
MMNRIKIQYPNEPHAIYFKGELVISVDPDQVEILEPMNEAQRTTWLFQKLDEDRLSRFRLAYKASVEERVPLRWTF